MDQEDINRALDQLLNEPETSGENFVEIQVRNPDARKNGEKIEVFYSRKTTAVSPQNSDDEGDYGSRSDTELLPSEGLRHRKYSFGAKEEDKTKPRHTTLRYRRRGDGQWRQVKASDTPERKGQQQDELEVDVKEELSEATGIVTTTYQARWKVLKYEHLPEWLQDNEFLRHGHRPPLPSFAECFKSILSLHTETGNIWTHLIGSISLFKDVIIENDRRSVELIDVCDDWQ